MKQLVVIPLVLGLAALAGYGFLRAVGAHLYVREMIAGLIPSVVAGIAALVPALLQRPHGQAAVVQGAFHGMVIHIGVTVALALVLFLTMGMKGPSLEPFAWWLMWFFAVTLMLVAASLIRVVRSAPIVRSDLRNP